MRKLMGRMVLVAVLLGMAGMMTGCTYMKYRGADALDVIDVGLTFSKRPQFAAYYRLPIPVGSIGYGKVAATLVGIGGGNVGVMPHYEESYGLILWGQEEVAYGDYNREDQERLNYEGIGIGLFNRPVPPPGYFLGCPHYLHLGWIGAAGMPRFHEAIDFALGFTTLDIFRDDGRPRGYWPGQDVSPLIDPPASATGFYVGRGKWGIKPVTETATE